MRIRIVSSDEEAGDGRVSDQAEGERDENEEVSL